MQYSKASVIRLFNECYLNVFIVSGTGWGAGDAVIRKVSVSGRTNILASGAEVNERESKCIIEGNLQYYLAKLGKKKKEIISSVKGISIDLKGLPWCLSGKETACNAEITGDTHLIPRSRRSPGGGNGNSLRYSCLENPMDRGAWWGYSGWGRKE